MKAKIISILFILFIGIGATPQDASAQHASVNFQVFYDALSPYGSWVQSPEYGYVWVPDVDAGFSPYATNGHWILTDDGWTWVSDYPWGWATFHYGRWYTDATYGPMWVPDNEWGPGWVSWRSSGEYYGWAPILPGISISIAYSSRYNVPDNQWRFVRCRDFGRADIHNYYVSPTTNTTIIRNTIVLNNVHVDNRRSVTYNAGPGRSDVEKRTGRPITPLVVKESNRPGQHVITKGQLQIYRPQVQKVAPSGPRPAPAKVEELKNVRPPSQRMSQPHAQQPPPKPNTQQPVHQQPAQPRPQPRPQQPVHQQPAQPHPQQPVHQQPAQPRPQQPVHQQPAQPRPQQPVHQQPAQPHVQQPVHEQPAPEHPEKKPPR